jgi:biopolymer transport protein ExbD
MAKIKMPKSNPSLDMTPMVDLAFLLVTFFMLTATSRVTEPVVIDTPSSNQDKLLPENVVVISLDGRGRPFFTINNPEVRKATLEKMGKQYNITFSEEEKKKFSGMTSFGVPIAQLKEYINMSDPERAAINGKVKGIPLDSADNQLSNWIKFGRIAERTMAREQQDRAKRNGRDFKDKPLRFAIKADSKTNFLQVKDVIKVFTDQDIYIFNLITNLEQTDAKPANG